MKDPLATPVRRTQSEISKAAGRLERLKIQRRVLQKKLDEKDGEIRTTAKFLRDLINEHVVDRIVGESPVEGGSDGSGVPL